MSRNTRNINLNTGPSRGAARSFASVVDTYVAPARGKSGWQSLSKALGVAGDIAGRQQDLAKEEKRVADQRRGELEGLAMSMEQDPAKIKAGLMYPQESKAFMMAITESHTKAWAYEETAGWRAEWETHPDRNSNDPGAYSGFMQEKISNFRRAVGGDQYAIAGATPVLQQAINNMSQEHTAYTAKRLSEDQLNANDGVILGVMESHNWDEDPDGMALVQAISFQADASVGMGQNGTLVNKRMIDGIINTADALNDTRSLRALALAHDDGRYRLTPAQMKQVDDALINIESELDAIDRDNELIQQQQQKDMEDKLLMGYQQAVVDDPMAMPDKSWPPEVYKNALALRSKLSAANKTTDPTAERAALINLNRVVYSADFEDMSHTQRLSRILPLLSDPNVSSAKVNEVMKMVNAKSDPQSAVNNSTITTFRKNAVTAVKTLSGGVFTLGNDNQIAVAFESAYNDMLIGYDLEGKTPKEIQGIHKEIETQVMMELLEQPQTRTALIESLEDNPALVHQFGLRDYFKDFYAEDQVAKAADELAALTGGS